MNKIKRNKGSGSHRKALFFDIRCAYHSLRVKGVESEEDFARVFIDTCGNEATIKDLSDFVISLQSACGDVNSKKLLDDMIAGRGAYTEQVIKKRPLLAYDFNKFIGKDFADINWYVDNNYFNTYLLRGGRSSLKSAFVSLKIIDLMVKNPLWSCVVFRNTYETIGKSCVNSIKWAIRMLGLEKEFNYRTKPLELTRKKTGQMIVFRGLDKADKTKGLTTENKTQFRIVWLEEAQEIIDPSKVRSVIVSAIRGELLKSDEGVMKRDVFITYNTPHFIGSWINAWQREADEAFKKGEKHPDFAHYSNYLNAPREWIGDSIIEEAEKLKKSNKIAYDYEFMGFPVGDGNNVFWNIQARRYSEQEIAQIKAQTNMLYFGLDFGESDPTALISCYYDNDKKILIIYEEFYKLGITIDTIRTDEHFQYHKLEKHLLVADNSKPLTITLMSDAGFKIIPCEKGRDSVNAGIMFLKGLRMIAIDEIRCPNTYREFKTYSYRTNKDGIVEGAFVDKNNHSIDAVRYALEHFYKRKKLEFPTKQWSEI